MIVKNEYIKIMADKEITITNYIYDRYLEFVAKAQYDKNYMDFSMVRCYLKFDTPFDDIDEKETTDFDMAIPFSNRNLTMSENTVEANYTFTPLKNKVYNTKTYESIGDFTDYIGKKITAIGFGTMVLYEEYIVACVDTSNYSTYFINNISFQRKDIFTSDTTVKDGTPINLTPFSNKTYTETTGHGTSQYFCYPALYSIGLGTRRGEMQEEYIIKKNDEEQNYLINLGDIELCKIDNYQDKIYKQDDKWYLHKEIAKIELNSNQNWSYHGRNSSRTNSTLFSLQNAINDMEQVTYDYNTKCNYFEAKDVYRNDDVGYFVHYSNQSYIYVAIDRNIVSNLLEWNDWLDNHQAIIYYVLQSPIDTEITDTNLIQQLEAIELYNGINNITTTGDLAGDLQIYYNYTTTGEVARGHNLNIDVDINKDYWLGSLFGDIYQNENPTPTTPQDIKVVTGNQNINIKSKTSLEPNEVEIVVESNTSFGFNLRKGLESNKYPSIMNYTGNNLYPLPLKVNKELQPHNKLYTGSGIVPLLSDYKYIMYKYRYYYYDDFMGSYIDLDEYFITNLPNNTKGLFEIVTKIERSDV